MITKIILQAAVREIWADRYSEPIAAANINAAYHGTGDALASALHANREADLVILDMALATTALAGHLGPFGPRVLAFGDADHAGIALGSNLADFLPDRPSPVELTAAISAALEPVHGGNVADLSDRAMAKLAALSGQATRATEALARLSMAPPAGAAPPINPGQIRAMIRARRARDGFFRPDIFGEPAWDMLLDLACAATEGHDVAVSSLCIAAAVPTTTALRWIKNLCDAGMFERRDDPRDARRAFISLSGETLAAMARYLAQAPSAGAV